MPILSVCIPTYNYGAYIGEALESIAAQASAEVEVVVLDSGSTDNTQHVVRKFASALPHLRYEVEARPGGIDRDLARTVALARGEYCWLLSADDAFAPGALARILRECAAGFDLMLANRTWCDAQLNPIWYKAWLRPQQPDRAFDFFDDAQMAEYLASASSLGALFSFMSTLGFRRDLWLRAGDDPRLVGSNYAHVHRLFKLARAGAKLSYVAAPLILCRSGNDSFAQAGLASRLAIDLAGYLQLSQALFPGNRALQQAFRAVLRREHSWRVWMYARETTCDRNKWQALERLLGEYGMNRAQLLAIRAIAIVSGLRRRFLRRTAIS